MAQVKEHIEESSRPAGAGSGAALRGSVLDRPLLSVVSLNWEMAFYVTLVIISALMRFWDLGTRALHHDESLHALYSYYLFSGKGYQHDPMMHGPFQFHATALGYFLFGVSDYTARIVPALFGTVLVGLPYFLRDQLGRKGARVAAIMLAFSPSLLYYSRFARNDIYILVWTVLLVIAMFRYIQERKNLYLYLSAAAISLNFATKEVAFITLAIFGSFLIVINITKLPLLLQLFRRRPDTSSWPASLVLALFMGTFLLPQLSATSTVLAQRLNITFAGQTSIGGFVVPSEGIAGGIVVAIFLAVGAAVGHRSFGRVWSVAAAVFYVIYVLLYTTFFTNMPGFGTGIWGSLGYWLIQHGVERGAQPNYYYLILLAIYEFFPVILGLIGTIYFVIRRNLFAGFLIYWTYTAAIAYAVAGEKMPWLVLHIVLPLVLLAAMFLGKMVDKIEWRPLVKRNTLYLVVLVVTVVFGLLAVFRVTGPSSTSAAPGLNAQGIFLLVIVVGAVGLSVRVASRLGVGRSLQTLMTIVVAALFLLTLRAGIVATYYNGDIPVEMLVYTQTSPEIPKIKADIDRIAMRSGQGKDLKITVDATNGFSWPWAWYLREYKNVDHPGLSSATGPPLGSVLLLHDNNADRMKPFLTKYGQPQKYHHRWWFPEDYKELTPAILARDVFSPTNWSKWSNYMLYRQISNPLGSENGLFYVQKDLVGTTVTRSAGSEVPREYVDRQLNIKSTLAFGSKGSAAGQLSDPKAVAVDSQGNTYVADSSNSRIQKFDPTGKVLAQVGREGRGDGEFIASTGGAWGIAVDSEGYVYVADTWNHRIQKFDSNLTFVAKWGENVDTKGVAQGNGGKFYGPRAVTIDPDGNLLVSDTGNHRVQKFSSSGDFLGSFGGIGSREGQFMEPVGIGVDRDGIIYVADTWNHRIQKFDKAFKFIAQIPVSGWESTGILNKPHLAVEPGGNIVVTDPENHRLLRFSGGGSLLGVINKYGSDNSSFNMPIGVAVDRQGNIYVAESVNHRIQKFEALK